LGIDRGGISRLRETAADRRERPAGRKGTDSMDVKIKATVNFSVSDSSMEDALAEYDELTVEGLIREILDKAIACDEISVKVIEGPNNLEEFDQLNS
jgi:hypothetical protein